MMSPRESRKSISPHEASTGGMLKMLGLDQKQRDTVESFADLARIKVFGAAPSQAQNKDQPKKEITNLKMVSV